MGKDEINAFLGAGASFEGKLEFTGAVRIDGGFLGEVESEGTLIIGKDAVVRGFLKVGRLVVSGRFEGEATATRNISLHRSAKVYGTLATPGLSIEEGAMLEGKVSMGGEGREEKRPARVEILTEKGKLAGETVMEDLSEE